MAEILYLGVDIGGTKVAAGLVSAAGEIVCKGRAPMNVNGSPEEGLASVIAAMNKAMELGRGIQPDFKLGGVGICSPGPLDPRTGAMLERGAPWKPMARFDMETLVAKARYSPSQ